MSGQEYKDPSQGDVWLYDPGSPLLETLLGHQNHQQVRAQGDLVLESTPGIPSTRLWPLSPARGPWNSLGSKATSFPLCSLGESARAPADCMAGPNMESQL